MVEKNLNQEESKYCPYCREVLLGKPDDDWLLKTIPRHPTPHFEED